MSEASADNADNISHRLVHDRSQALVVIRRYLREEKLLIGHNIAFDLAVLAHEDPSLLPLIFQAYVRGRIRDTGIRQQLIDIAKGQLRFHADEDGEIVKTEYHLADLVRRHFGQVLDK